ncbi:MAG: hypothetical protein WA441_13430 [Methyloceanibacter sp.]
MPAPLYMHEHGRRLWHLSKIIHYEQVLAQRAALKEASRAAERAAKEASRSVEPMEAA